MENKEIAQLFSETADLMEVAGEDGFRIRSYRNAAAAILSHPERVQDIVCNPSRRVTDIPGIGKGLAAVLSEICQRGSFDRRDQMLARYPASALELLKIQGLGPKSIALLYEHHGVKSVDDLERICRQQKLRALPRMGVKLEEKVLRSIDAYRKSAGRYLLNFGQRVADELIGEFSALPGIEKALAAGSLRRGRETIGDLDILVTGPEAGTALNHLVKHPKAQEILGQGVNKASVTFGIERLQVDVRALPHASFGAAMQYFTGSKEHNVVLRTNAIKQGLTLNEYGLFTLEGNQRVAGESEEEIYRRLGYAWIPPEIRENSGELEAAGQGTLPKLIELADMRGDLHMHTTETDGRATLREMAEAAAALGYEYIAITDHSKALAMANGLDEKRVAAFAQQVRELNRDGLPLHIFSGLECDILRDGALDISEDALAGLDVVIGSVHSHMSMEPQEMTDRLLRALAAPSLRILGHATGRLLLQRESYGYDFDRVATAAAARGVLFEINASPERLDLPSHLVRAARRKGCRFTISTDAHRQSHLGNMRFGVVTARRGWLTAACVEYASTGGNSKRLSGDNAHERRPFLTMRSLAAPSLRILGHATGRLLLQRESYGYDFDRVATAAAARGVLFEINASPERLDLPSQLVRAAKRKGCRFTISTDAHRQSHLGNMRFGVVTARRGWLSAADVLNTRPLAEFQAALQR